MKIGKYKLCTLILVFTLSLPSFVYADNYRLSGSFIPNAPSGYFEFIPTEDDYLYDRAYNAFYYWNSLGNSYFGKSILRLRLDTNRKSIDNNQLYTITVLNDPNNTRSAVTAFSSDGSIIIILNEDALDNEFPKGTSDYDEKSMARNRAYESAVAHELGHCVGLDDLKLFDTRDAIMSEYVNRSKVYQPTNNDFSGVRVVYSIR